jgi:hypothetical protein
MTNPFDASSHPKALINIPTGMHATREIQEWRNENAPIVCKRDTDRR